MSVVNGPGNGFCRAIEAHGATEDLVAGLIVCGVARSSLWTACVDHSLVARIRSSVLRPMADLPLRQRFSDLLKHCDPETRTWPGVLSRKLTVYGMTLSYEGHYLAARDAFGIVADSPFVYLDTRLLAMERRAASALFAGHHLFALTAYLDMERHAADEGLNRHVLRARIGRATVHIEMNQPGEAEAIFHETLAAAERCWDRDATARCQANLGCIVGRRGDFGAAYRFSIAASPSLPTEAARLRALYNAGWALMKLGRMEDARPIALEVMRETREASVRAEAAELLDLLGPAPAVLEPATMGDLEGVLPLAVAVSRAAGA